MKIIRHNDKRFKRYLETLFTRRFSVSKEVEDITGKIVRDVKRQGDSALFRCTKKYDNFSVSSSTIQISKDHIKEAYGSVDKSSVSSLKAAASKIKIFHKKQLSRSWKYKDSNGTVLGQRVTPLDRVGIYVPGGKAAYPSSVLMNAIPAKIAGVTSIIMLSPTPNDQINPYTLIAADIAGVDKIFRVGGAQAIAAAAYGTKTIHRVDKIVGPGNIYVTLAKRLVFGEVDIDMIAGPSEILIIADHTARPDFIAADILSQAEHDEMAVPILVSISEQVAESAVSEIKKQKVLLKRRDIVERSLKKNLIIIIPENLRQAADIANKIAPEHLELAVNAPFALLKLIKNAGSVFLGNYTPEALGDYAAGPNHVLPTGGTARFFSPLGVYDFQKRTSIISFSKRGCKRVAPMVEKIALMEGLDAHAKAVTIRK